MLDSIHLEGLRPDALRHPPALNPVHPDRAGVRTFVEHLPKHLEQRTSVPTLNAETESFSGLRGRGYALVRQTEEDGEKTQSATARIRKPAHRHVEQERVETWHPLR